MQVTIGGERLGSGNKNKVTLRTYERSTFDLSYTWRSTMAAGTLVPFMTEVALPGDTFDIDLNVDVLTHPTIGPLFGSYKIQLDVFQVPIRLYQAKLHMNMLGIGMDMSQVLLPRIAIKGNAIDLAAPIDNQQINPSCIFSYLGIRGLGQNETGPQTNIYRHFNAVPYLGYWDIVKNYYSNKQEEIGAVIHRDVTPQVITLTTAELENCLPPLTLPIVTTPPFTYQNTTINNETRLVVTGTGFTENTDPSFIVVALRYRGTTEQIAKITDIFQHVEVFADTDTVIATTPVIGFIDEQVEWGGVGLDPYATYDTEDTEPKIVTFPLANIDQMRMDILADVASTTPFTIFNGTQAPYGLALQEVAGTPNRYSCLYGQEGLALKTYQSDLFNNWISTEWIDGPNGISAITAVDTSSGSFTIDELNMSKKVYDMLNRIAISGGSYDDWLDAVYTHERTRSAENPMYLGGLIRNLIFQEVVSNSRAIGQPLGTLAGRGKVGPTQKGGKVIVKVDEPSYIMGIVSLTPNVDYSQGNKWDTQLKTMNDFHKPALDEIGFQDLITDQMVWYDTTLVNGEPIYKSAGKQPAWINYMTNVDVVKGNFADQNQQMFMVLNRRYGASYNGTHVGIKDLTTYIDPSKFNHIFADTRRDAQNFWTQIGVNIEARRKMSSKVMPNL